VLNYTNLLNNQPDILIFSTYLFFSYFLYIFTVCLMHAIHNITTVLHTGLLTEGKNSLVGFE